MKADVTKIVNVLTENFPREPNPIQDALSNHLRYKRLIYDEESPIQIFKLQIRSGGLVRLPQDGVD